MSERASTVTDDPTEPTATASSTATANDRPAKRNERRGAHGKLSGFLHGWLVFLGLVVVWEAGARIAGSAFFPPPTEILAATGEQWFGGPAYRLFLSDMAVNDLLGSLGRVALGWLSATVIGVTIGTFVGRSRTGMEYAGPLMAFIRAIPPPVLVPVFIVLLGIDVTMQVTVIVFGVVWPILLNTVDGVRSVDQTKIDTARSFQVPRGQWLFFVVLPAAAPKIFAGLRVSLSLALVLMVISELVGSTNGIGYQLMFSQQEYDFPAMWSGIVLLGVLGYVLNTLLLAVERRALQWKPA